MLHTDAIVRQPLTPARIRRSPEEAAAFVRQLQAILRHIDASDANMERVCPHILSQRGVACALTCSRYEQGELRCDVNVSVQRTAPGSPRGTRCEVKNLNGVRFLQAAIGTPTDMPHIF